MRHVGGILLLLGLGCSPELPDPESRGALLMGQYCGACHPVHAPGSMTFGMWEMKLQAMHNLFAQRGIPWLPTADEATLRDYLRAHAGQG